MLRTFRYRLAIWNTGVVALTALLALWGVHLAVDWALLHEMDQILFEDIEEVDLVLKDAAPNDLAAVSHALALKASGHKKHGWFVELYSDSGDLNWSSRGASEGGGCLGKVTRDTPCTLDNVRVVTRQLDPNNMGMASVLVGASLTPLNEDLNTVDRLFLWAVIAVVVATPPLGYWLAGRATGQLGEIVHTARQLRPSHMEERLPITGSGDEFDQLAATVNSLLDRIGEDVRQKRDFLANAAHELRTPLAAIRTSIEVELANPNAVRAQDGLLLEVMELSQHLEVLVNQLLLISESNTPRLEADNEVVELNVVARQAVDMFSGLAEAKNVSLTLTAQQTCYVSGSEKLLRQLTNNLIDNALKYTSSGGVVSVHVTKSATSDSVNLVVSDTGKGIPQADLPRIFDRFFRGEKARTRDGVGGTGLGLSICLAVAEAHRGTIECNSRVNEGTTITVRLPASRSASA